jgi:hypothetical protein
MKRATIYWRKKQFLIHSSSRTTDGVWIIWSPCLAVPEASDDSELKQAIRTTLDASRMGVPHPQVWRGLLDPLFALAGVKTWNAFSNGASCMEVEEVGSRVLLIPMKNLGAQEGFQPDVSTQIVLDRESDDLATSVRRLLGYRTTCNC